MNNLKKMGYTFIWIIGITIIIQILTMLKSVYLASSFGASQTLDAFYLANIFTITVFNIISAAITTVCIPFLAYENDKEKSEKVMSQFITRINLAAILFIFVFYIILFLFINYVGYSFDTANKQYFLIISGILFIGQFFRIETAFSTAVLQTDNSFILAKFATLLANLTPIVYIVLNKNLSLVVLTWYIVLGFVIEFLVTFIGRKKNKNNSFGFNFSKLDPEAKKIINNSFPIMLSSTVFQLQLIFSNYMIGFFGEGYISILSNTNQIIGIFQILFVSNLVTMIYPKIAKDVKNNLEVSLKNLSIYISVTNALIILLVWGYVSLGKDLIVLLFVRGEFTLENANSVYLFGLVLIFSLPISVIRDYIYRFLYSVDRVNVPTRNAIETVCINIILIIILSNFIGAYSIVVSSLLSTCMSTILILIKFKKMGYCLEINDIVKKMIFLNIVGILMYLFLMNFKLNVYNSLTSFILNALIGGVFYSVLILVGNLLFYKREKRC